MKLSLIIPIYKAEPFLPRLFENLEAQGVFFDDHEFGEAIFVNDGSPDNSESIILEYGKKHPWVRLLRQENQGQHIARNTGILATKGDYIAFMDQDDAYARDGLRILLLASIDYNAEVTRGQFKTLSENDFIKWTQHDCADYTVVGCKDGINIILERNGLHYDDFVWASMYNRSFLVKNSILFDPKVRYNEDGAFVWNVFPEAKRVLTIENVVYFWVQRIASESHNSTIEHRVRREAKAEDLAVFMRELCHKYRKKFGFPERICQMMLRGSHWTCYKYVGTMVKLRGLTREEINPTVKRLKDEGIYPYPHSFPKDLPDGYPTSLPYKILWRLMSYEWILKLMLRLRTKK